MHMRATQHFHRDLLLIPTQQKKVISEKHTEITLEFLIFLKKANKRRKTKTRKTIYTKNSQQAKEEMINLFGFSFNTTTNLN